MTIPTIECELRAFVDDTAYGALFERLKREASYAGVQEQETWYFDGPQDLRIQKNDGYAKVWLKKGAMHDEAREEIEVRVGTTDFPKLASLFDALGYRVSIKWFRTRHSFRLGEVEVTLDDTRGYAKIIEFEKVCAPEGREAAVAELKTLLSGFGLSPTTKEDSDARFARYKADWRDLTGEA